jgi:predicted nucleotide-binding protein (sugar kinase/HSP70/actin superfamily)
MNASCDTIRSQQSSANLEFLHDEIHQWRESPSEKIAYVPKEETIFLSGGLSLLQDRLIESALNSLGINYLSLPNADFASFQTGKAFGNRGQCNPTYFTVGNLVKYLQKLRDEQGLSSEEIVKKYVYVTAGGCGPCRFGMYITEYKKALRDAGFEGLRITAFEHNKGIYQGEDIDDVLIDYTPKFFITLIKAVIIGDIINMLGYKMRPYEITRGSVDQAMEACRALVADAFLEKRSLLKTMWRCRRILEKVALNRLQPKAKVMVMGEFWAAMTEGDGNYNLHRFLEAEGAECIPQPIINRLMLSLWEAEQKLYQNETLQSENTATIDFSHTKTRILLKAGKLAVKTYFNLYAKAIGLHDYHIPDIDKLASYSKEYYTLECDGGEGHLEVAHLVESVKENLAHLVISVKPFGCMPSSSVSDGIQSLVTARFPQANFLAIETSGEGAANFDSRVQMALFKAKQAAKEEFDALDIPDTLPERVHNYLYQPSGEKAGSAAKIIYDVKHRGLYS